jgi:Na+-driven multidrug efflux pump
MAAQGFWIALTVGLTISATGLLVMLRSIARDRMPARLVHAHGV